MGILTWERPQQVMSLEQWRSISADGAPPGVYTPNMSAYDQQRYKAKLIGKGTPEARIEIRKTAIPQHGDHAQILIIVTLKDDGLNWKRRDFTWVHYDISPGANVKISMNSAAQFSFREFLELQAAVEEAKRVLIGVSKLSDMGT